jgi:formylglycine-generating enzyme required for sulfatase activity
VVAVLVGGVMVSHAHVARSQDEQGDAGIDGGETRSGTGTGTGTGESQVGAGGCGLGMIEVEGDYCPELPEQRCLKWASATSKGRCAEFAPSEACAVPTVKKHFCMDRFEYPNQPGENPLVMKNWFEAKALCGAAGKRLCNDSEWTLACEGPERLPYPYGLSRDSSACNIDKPPINPKEEDLRSVQRRDAEAKRLWQGEASGARDRCKSAFGVQDMTGNVDEWVVNEKGKPHKSGLKGGYWSWVRGRCRPLTDGHAEDFRYYQIGFRCCADAPAGGTTASR